MFVCKKLLNANMVKHFDLKMALEETLRDHIIFRNLKLEICEPKFSATHLIVDEIFKV